MRGHERLIAIVATVLAVGGFAVWPLVWRWSAMAAALLAIILTCWVIGSIVLYLRWARRLGRERAAMKSSTTH